MVMIKKSCVQTLITIVSLTSIYLGGFLFRSELSEV